MDLNLHQAFRLPDSYCMAAVGAGGKTSVIFSLARELTTPVIITTTTHFHENQIRLADVHYEFSENKLIGNNFDIPPGVTLFSGPIKNERLTGLDNRSIRDLVNYCKGKFPILIEADGSRQHQLKAPAKHEPVIPDIVDTVLVVAGMDAIGKILTEDCVHRSQIFSQITKLPLNQVITQEAVVNYLIHPFGGLKGIPPSAKRIALLTHNPLTPPQLADDELKKLLSSYDSIVLATIRYRQDKPEVKLTAVHEPITAIILAAGRSKRYGEIKQLLPWNGKNLIQYIVETTLSSRISEVILVIGSRFELIEPVVKAFPINIHRNINWQEGIGSSIRGGMQDISPKSGAVIFILADQPAISKELLNKLIDIHSQTLSPIIAPRVMNTPTNPVLFDRSTFYSLMDIHGDIGGKSLFSQFPVSYFSWDDEKLLKDIDTPEDYFDFIQQKKP